jgi:uncharacterized protein (TIGR02145 family)
MSANVYQLARLPIVSRTVGYYLRWYYNGWHYWQFFGGALTFETSGQKYRTYGAKAVTLNSGQLTADQVAAVRTVLNAREVYLYTDAGWQLCRIVPAAAPIVNNFLQGYEVTFTAYIGSRLISQTGYSPVVIPPVAPPPLYCEVAIGTQIWMCRNWDAAYPASKVFNDDESNRVNFGGLYRFDQVNSAGFCPTGWHVPSVAEWNILITFLGGAAIAGGKLKQAGTMYWSAPNYATNDYSFGMRSTGYGLKYGDVDMFSGLGIGGYLWTADVGGAGTGKFMEFRNDYIGLVQTVLDKLYFIGVRLIKDVYTLPEEVTIGTQTWKVKNYDENYAGSLCPNNDPAMVADYGRFYRQTDIVHLSPPAGWHFPTWAEWSTLITYVGGLAGNAGKLKETGTVHWNSPNSGATNTSGFFGRAAGNATPPNYMEFGNRAAWWCADLTGGNGQAIELLNSNGDITHNAMLSPDLNWMSLRLIKD